VIGDEFSETSTDTFVSVVVPALRTRTEIGPESACLEASVVASAPHAVATTTEASNATNRARVRYFTTKLSR
jgi:hypothetical protein